MPDPTTSRGWRPWQRPSQPNPTPTITAPPPVPTDLTEILTAATASVGYALDTDDLVIATALRSDLIARLVHLAAGLAAHRHLRTLVHQAHEAVRDIAHPDAPHEEEIADTATTVADLDRAIPHLEAALAQTCRDLHAAGMGAIWPTPQPPPSHH